MAKSGKQLKPPVDMPIGSQTAMDQLKKAREIADTHLTTFDDLDFIVFSNQDWNGLKKIHAADIKVYWPDGRMVRRRHEGVYEERYMSMAVAKRCTALRTDR